MVPPAHNDEDSSLLHHHGVHRDSIEDSPASIRSPFDRKLALQLAAAMYSFSNLGLFNSSIGAVLPLITSYYDLTDLRVSLIFLAGPVGYILAAQCSPFIHHRFGQFGIAVIGPVLQISASVCLFLHPRFGVALVGFGVQGMGSGVIDGSWCSWAGSMKNANVASGLLHGAYSSGAAAGPLFVALFVERGQLWYKWYFVSVGISVLELVILCAAFRNETAAVYRKSKLSEQTRHKSDFKEILRRPATWLCAAFSLADVGVETAISGWVVSFMLRSRHSGAYLAGASSSGFWGGMAVGRIVLGPVTERLRVRRATILYFGFAIIIEVLFAILPSPIVSVILMTWMGFIMGPLFPSGVIVLTQLLPGELHVAAVSFVASLGQFGGALLPFVIGAVVQTLGIGIFRFAIIVQSIAALGIWVVFARLRRLQVPVGTRALVRENSDDEVSDTD